MEKKIRSVLIETMRSVALLMELNQKGNGFSVPVDTLLEWIEKFDIWWKTSSGVTEGRNLHLLYGRNISLFGSRILSLSSQIVKLSRLAHRQGFSCLLRVDLVDSFDYKRELLNDLAESGTLHILLDAGNLNSWEPDHDAALSIVETLVEKGVSVGLVGPLEFWMKMGALESPILNATTFQVIPGTPRDDVLKIISTSKRKYNEIAIPQQEEVAVDMPTVTPNFFDPCMRRFQLFVSPNGQLYPCNGLIGIEAYSLGTVYDSLEDTVLGGARNINLDFEKLANVGPQLSLELSSPDNSELPMICSIHRRTLVESDNVPH